MALGISWVLCLFVIVNILLLERRDKRAFLVSISSQPLWLIFDIKTGAYGLLPLVGIFAYLNWRTYSEANARRIVACVNALAGVSTEALEAGAVKALVTAAREGDVRVLTPDALTPFEDLK